MSIVAVFCKFTFVPTADFFRRFFSAALGIFVMFVIAFFIFFCSIFFERFGKKTFLFHIEDDADFCA